MDELKAPVKISYGAQIPEVAVTIELPEKVLDELWRSLVMLVMGADYTEGDEERIMRIEEIPVEIRREDKKKLTIIVGE